MHVADLVELLLANIEYEKVNNDGTVNDESGAQKSEDTICDYGDTGSEVQEVEESVLAETI